MNTALISTASIVLYLTSGTLLAWRLMRRPDLPKLPVLAPGLLAAVLHGLLLYHWIHVGMDRDLSFFNVASLLAWIMTILVLLGSLRMPMENVGIAILPLAAVTIITALLFPMHHIVHDIRSPDLLSHILISILAYSLLTIAALQALLLALQHRHLRNRQPGGFVRALPPLQTMETLLFQMIWAGFILLGLSLVTGVLYIDDIFAQHLVHKTVLSIIAWLVFAVLLWGRYRFGWRGRTAVRWTLWGFGFLALAYFGSKLVLELILQR
ncbi:cytochrome C assembly family protein [Thioalbus denitrificans]|uniref:ABC-type uncharacterized transport system permease subunit n=1 Tax=Thioalbus denitrificans TaxID=547122 RepID=A0A369CAZ5_9GAMM|nr:cytochrome c biogenesis protein CcsA [Thioalbus denitrificans]RCX29817.1 ABC-type uncharacterized transport system permease subunit [Thioalbus denitrificans]